jgi:(p)ppGpp synthase/HD superfamily hydrolase
MKNTNPSLSSQSIRQRIINFQYTPNFVGELEKDKEKFLGISKKQNPAIFNSDVLQEISKAIDLVGELFKDDVRGDGTKFYTHFLETAYILLTKFNFYDKDTIIAAILHDSVEDKNDLIKYEDIKNEFGDEVAQIVDGVTKITTASELEETFHTKFVGKIDYNDQELATIKKVFEAGLLNPKVFFVKFADRFHNINTLYGIKRAERRREIAQQTIDIYVPLIQFFGYEEPAKELRDLCLFHIIARNSEEAQNLYKKLVNIHSKERDRFLKLAQEHNVEMKIKDILASIPQSTNLVVAHKTLYDLYLAIGINSEDVPPTYQHFYWIIEIPFSTSAEHILEVIQQQLKNKFGYINSERLTNEINFSKGEQIYNQSIYRNTYLLPSNDFIEIVFNIVPTPRRNFDITDIIFKKQYHIMQNNQEYLAFIDLIEYLYKQNVPDKMKILFEYAKRLYPTDFVIVWTYNDKTAYTLPRGSTVFDLAHRIYKERVFRVLGGKIYRDVNPLMPEESYLKCEVVNLKNPLENGAWYDFLPSSTEILDTNGINPYTLSAIYALIKYKERRAKDNLTVRQILSKKVLLKGLDKTGLSSQITSLANTLNISFNDISLKRDESGVFFRGHLTADFNSMEQLNFFVIELAKIQEILHINVQESE